MDNNIRLASEHYRNFMAAIGMETDSEHSKDTPMRVAKMFYELTEGLRERNFKMTTFAAQSSVPVVVRDIEFYSLCAHHHAPFFGTFHLAYKPAKKMVGLSKIPRLVKWCSRLPTTQEELTQHIAKQFYTLIEPVSVYVEAEAKHLCMSMRGIETQGARTFTSAYAGHKDHIEPLRQLMRQ